MSKFLAALAVGFAILALGMQTAKSAPQTVTVHMTDFSFKPADVTVQIGQTVIFQNDDDVPHNVTADAFKSGDVDAGKSWKYTFAKAGTYAYVCTYHPGMKGTVTVAEAQSQ